MLPPCISALYALFRPETNILFSYPQGAISLKPGETLRFTNENSETPCTMVESNGRAYTSSNWESIIKVDNGKPKGFVKVTYRLFCRDGVQQ